MVEINSTNMSSDIHIHSILGVYVCTYTCTLMHMLAFPLVLHNRGVYVCVHMHSHAQPYVTHERMLTHAYLCTFVKSTSTP